LKESPSFSEDDNALKNYFKTSSSEQN